MMTSQNAASLEEIVKAVAAILDPSSSSATRTAAHALCEQVKTLPHATDIAFQLLTVDYPLSARMFGLNILDGWVRTRMVVEEAVALRDRIWGLLGLVVSVRAEERRLMQDKTALLIAQLALRIWPQYWPDFFERLLELVSLDGAQLEGDPNSVIRTEMGLLMARSVVDEIHPREASGQKELVLDDARRPELQKALSVVLPLMLGRIYVLLPYCANRWNETQMRMMRPLLETMMEAFGSMSVWAPLVSESSRASVLALLRIALISEDLRGCALEVFQHFGTRPVRASSGEMDIIGDLFDGMVDGLRDLLGLLASSGDADEDYDHFKRLADSFVTIGVNTLCFKKQPCVPSRLDAVLDLYLQLSAFPSLLVSTNASILWSALVKSEKMIKHPALVARLPSLFLHCLLVLAMDVPGERRRKPYNVEDFAIGDVEADGDFVAMATTLQNRCMELLRQMAQSHPSSMVEFISSAISTFLRDLPSLSQHPSKTHLDQWSALTHAADCILRPCLGALLKQQTTLSVSSATTATATTATTTTSEDATMPIPDLNQINRITAILGDPSLWNPLTVHPEILYAWSVSIRSLLTIMGVTQNGLFSALVQALFNVTLHYQVPSALIQSDPIYASPAKVESMRVAIRMRSGSTILKTCSQRLELFIPATGYLVDLYHQTGHLVKERELMIELLLTVALANQNMPLPHENASILQLILGSIWEEQRPIDALLQGGGHVELLRAAGLGDLLQEGSIIGEFSEEATAFRRMVSNQNTRVLRSLTLMKKLLPNLTSDAMPFQITQFCHQMAQSLVMLTAAMHRLFHRDTFVLRTPEMGDRWNLLFGDLPSAIIPASTSTSTGNHSINSDDQLPAVDKLLDADAMADSMEQLPGKGAKGWIFMLRVSCYMNYGMILSLAPPLPAISQHLEMLFPNALVDSFSLSQIALVTKHLLTPLILSSGAIGEDCVKGVLLMAVERFGLVRLESQWQQFKAAQSQNNNTHSTALSAESAMDSLLTTATNAILSIVYDVLLAVRDKTVDPSLDVASLQSASGTPSITNAVIHDQRSHLAFVALLDGVLAPKIVLFMEATLRWKASAFTNKTLSILNRHLPTLLLSHQSVHATIFGPILAQLMALLANSSLSDHHAAITMSLVELYKWSLFLLPPQARSQGNEIFAQPLSALLPAATVSLVIQELNRCFLTTPNPPSLKSQRTAVKNTLVRAIHQHALSSVGVVTVLPKLPDRLVIMKKLTQQIETDDYLPDVAALFD